MFKNIMLKISGESLAGDNEQGFDFDVLNDLSQNIKILALKDLKCSFLCLKSILFKINGTIS